MIATEIMGKVRQFPSVSDSEIYHLLCAWFIDQGIKHRVDVSVERFGGDRGSTYRCTVWANRTRIIEFADWELTVDKPLKMLVAEKMSQYDNDAL